MVEWLIPMCSRLILDRDGVAMAIEARRALLSEFVKPGRLVATSPPLHYFWVFLVPALFLRPREPKDGWLPKKSLPKTENGMFETE